MTDDTLTIDPHRPPRELVPAEVYEHICQEAGIWGPLAETLRLWRVEGLSPVEVARRLSITLGACLSRLQECERICAVHDWSRGERDVIREIIDAHRNHKPGGSAPAAEYDERGRRVGARPTLVDVDDMMGRRWR